MYGECLESTSDAHVLNADEVVHLIASSRFEPFQLSPNPRRKGSLSLSNCSAGLQQPNMLQALRHLFITAQRRDLHKANTQTYKICDHEEASRRSRPTNLEVGAICFNRCCLGVQAAKQHVPSSVLAKSRGMS